MVTVSGGTAEWVEGESEMAGIQLFEPHITKTPRAQLSGAVPIKKEES